MAANLSGRLLHDGIDPPGGGLWKNVLYGHPLGLLRRDLCTPLITSALHFLSFSVSPKALRRWRALPLRRHYTFFEDGMPPVEWCGELFVDSGGFMLLSSPHLDLSPFGMPFDRLGEEILRLQLDMGADRIASLDWPIPPGLDREEVERRMCRTMEEAIRCGRALSELPAGSRPDWMVPVHGPTPEAAAAFAVDVLARLRAEGLLHLVSGVAVGSMVPLRMRGWEREIVDFVRSVRTSVPDHLPIHVFGAAGSIVPFLLRAGAVSFDSSTYVQRARNLRWIDPRTRRSLDIRAIGDADRYPCDCPVCSGRSPRLDIAVLEGRVKGRRSAVYAAIALHNLEVDLRLFREAADAWRAGRIDALLEELPRRFPSVRMPNPQPSLLRIAPARRTPVRQRSPDDFDLRRTGWEPAPEKEILLILLCSHRKPYFESPSFRHVWGRVEEALGEQSRVVQVVFLSGLYGPVPLELAEEEAVMSYDFRLHHSDREGILRVAERLSDLLRRTSGRFRTRIAFLPSPAYRAAARKAAAGFPDVRIFGRRSDLPGLVSALLEVARKPERGAE